MCLRLFGYVLVQMCARLRHLSLTGSTVRSGRAGRPAARRGPCREGVGHDMYTSQLIGLRFKYPKGIWHMLLLLTGNDERIINALKTSIDSRSAYILDKAWEV